MIRISEKTPLKFHSELKDVYDKNNEQRGNLIDVSPLKTNEKKVIPVSQYQT